MTPRDAREYFRANGRAVASQDAIYGVELCSDGVEASLNIYLPGRHGGAVGVVLYPTLADARAALPRVKAIAPTIGEGIDLAVDNAR